MHSNLVIRFDEKYHTYWYGNIKLDSVSKFISKFKPLFDREGLSRRVAEKNNTTQADILKQWDTKAKASTDYGKLMHSFIENYLTKRKYDMHDRLRLAMYTQEYRQYSLDQADHLIGLLVDFLAYLLEEYEIIGLEQIVCSLPLKLAGTYDCLARSYSTGEYVLFDWKTNKAIDTSSKWNKMLDPLEHLDDCNFNHYSLQLSLYQYMFQDRFNIARRSIIHINENKIMPLEVPYLEKELQMMFDYVKGDFVRLSSF